MLIKFNSRDSSVMKLFFLQWLCFLLLATIWWWDREIIISNAIAVTLATHIPNQSP